MCQSCVINTNKWLIFLGKEDECARDGLGNVILEYSQFEDSLKDATSITYTAFDKWVKVFTDNLPEGTRDAVEQLGIMDIVNMRYAAMKAFEAKDASR